MVRAERKRAWRENVRREKAGMERERAHLPRETPPVTVGAGAWPASRVTYPPVSVGPRPAVEAWGAAVTLGRERERED